MTTRRTIHAVVDVEADEPQVLGTYRGDDGDTVSYRDANGETRTAPADCVLILPLIVRLP